MKRALACTCALAALALLTGRAFSGEYTPCGEGSPTANFMVQNGDRAASIGRPALLYVYYGGKGTNADAKFMEGDEFLGNTDVKAQFKNFQCLRMDISRSDKMPKNWPLAITDRAKSLKSCLAVLTSDFSNIVYFKKGAGEAGVLEANPKNLLATMDSTLKYEAKKKELAAKDPKAKPKEDPPEQKAKPAVPGLGDDDPKKDPKKENKDKPKPKTNTPVEE